MNARTKPLALRSPVLSAVQGAHGALALRRGVTIPAAVFVVLLTASLPWWAGRNIQHLAVEFLYTLALAQMWNLLVGYGGLISIGQQAYVGIGGYALVVLGAKFGVPAFWVVPLAGLVGLAVALPLGAALFRLRGAHFAVGTWVAAEVLRLLVANQPSVGAGSGTSVTAAVRGMEPWFRQAMTLWVALALGVGATLGVILLLRSRWGLALMAVRDSEPAAASLGVSVPRIKWWVYLASAAGCAMTGALIYVSKLRISPDDAFSIEWTTTVFFIVVIGGIGTIEGPILGAVLYFVLRELMSDMGSVYLIVLGAIAVSTMLLLPQGLWGSTGWQLVPLQRRMHKADAVPGDETRH